MTKILEIAYALHVSSAFAVFGLRAEWGTTACARELKGLSGAAAEGREKVLHIKTFADWMKTDLQKKDSKDRRP